MPTIDKTQLMHTIRAILVGHVGFYEFPNNPNLVPAIAYLPDENYGYNYPPPDVTVTGVEAVVMAPTTNATPRNYSTVQYTDFWQLYLKQWDLSVDILQTVEALTYGLSQTYYTFRNWGEVGASEELGIIRSISFGILDEFVQYGLTT